MDHTEALPDDALAAILGRLQPHDLAASRCVRRAWRAVVDARRLLLPHLLPHSVEGIFANYTDHHRPQFLARPSTQHPGVDYGNLHFLPHYTEGCRRIADHCNGLLLYGDTSEFFVANPATRRWQRLPGTHNDGECREAYLAFDPAASPHYEVFLIPPKDLGLFDVSDCKSTEVQPEQLAEENFTLSSRFLSKPQWSTEVPQHSTEWPPAMLTLDVFSSNAGEWQERSFVREGSATRRVVNVRGSLPFTSSGVTRWRYGAYWRGALHVLLYRGAFVTRLSSSTGKYQVIKTPIDDNERKVGQHYLGSSMEAVYFANLRDRIRIWHLNESNGEVEWVLKNSIGLVEPSANIYSLNPYRICGPWIFDDDHVLDKYGNNKMLENVISDWDWDDDNVLDECGCHPGYCPLLGYPLLGFHPYKDIAFFLVGFKAVAYHFDSSKVQYIGHMRPRIHISWSLDESFIYTPCMIGDLPEKTKS